MGITGKLMLKLADRLEKFVLKHSNESGDAAGKATKYLNDEQIKAFGQKNLGDDVYSGQQQITPKEGK